MDIVFERLQHHTGDLGIIKLNRLKNLNALNHTMILDLFKQLIDWKQDPLIKAVLIKSEHEKAFCAGGDVRALYETGRQDLSSALQFFHDEYRLNYLIHYYPKPYIALINGITMGGGVGVSLHGSHRIAVGDVRLAMPETGIGLFPDVGGSYLLAHCPEPYGTYLALTGNSISTADALRIEWLDRMIQPEDEKQFIQQLLVTDLGHDAKVAVSHLARTFHVESEKAALVQHEPLIEECFETGSIESILDALQHNANTEAGEIFKTLSEKSPISLKITFKALQAAKNQSLTECLKMEYRMVNRCLAASDFYEGVRALLIDKDKSPQWQPSTLSDVTESMAQHYFDPLENELTVEDII